MVRVQNVGLLSSLVGSDMHPWLHLESSPEKALNSSQKSKKVNYWINDRAPPTVVLLHTFLATHTHLMQMSFISACMGVSILGALIMGYNPTVGVFCTHTQLSILQLKSRNIGGFLSISLVSQASLLHMSIQTYKKFPRERSKFFQRLWKSFGQQLAEWMLISLTTLVLGIPEVPSPITILARLSGILSTQTLCAHV